MKSAEKNGITMTCESCGVKCQRFGKHRNGLRRFRCPQCLKTYTEAHKPALDGSYVSQERIVIALRLMVEGNSLRSTERVTGLDINTLMKILVKAGEKSEKLLGKLMVNVPVRDVQCDEIWASVSKKEAHKLPEEAHDDSIGDAYCFVAIERHVSAGIKRHQFGRFGWCQRRQRGPAGTRRRQPPTKRNSHGPSFFGAGVIRPLMILPRRRQEQELWNIGRAWYPA